MTGPGGPRQGPIVTIDGPAGSGKSTTARAVAERLGFRHLDSGSLYRVLTWALLEAGIEPEAWDELEQADLARFQVELEPVDGGFRVFLDGRPVPDGKLRTREVTAKVSGLASLPPVRKWLLEIQRRAGALGRVVADGRDMGTVVFPDAEVKVFLEADLEERARRRLLQDGIEDPEEDRIALEAARLEERDRRDSRRPVSPLRVPEDAVVLDTTDMEFEEQVEAIVRVVGGG